MTEEGRIQQAKTDAVYLRDLFAKTQDSQLNEIAHRLDKFVTLVVDRDKGPTLEVRSENTQLKSQVDALTRERDEARQLAVRIDGKLKSALTENARLRAEKSTSTPAVMDATKPADANSVKV